MMPAASVDRPWEKSAVEIAKNLGVSAEQGLSEAEASERLLQFGPNVLAAEKKVSKFKRLLQQFKSPVVLILVAATIISALVGEYTDAVAILAIVIINSCIGYFQEAKAEAAIDALKKLSAPRARVLRGGSIRNIPSADICPGDIVVLEAGDYVAADARILKASQLSANEAILTGESLPVAKFEAQLDQADVIADRKNMLFAGTAVTTGSARAVVTATNMKTEIGRIAGMLEATEVGKTPLQKRLEQVSTRLIFLSGAVVVVVAILEFIRGDGWLEVFMSAISLAVAAIPEGLPTVVTLALALAIRRMVKRNALVRHLPAVETLGSTNVICTDKTGTLTTGLMKVREIYIPKGGILDIGTNVDLPQAAPIFECAVLCSNASLNKDGTSTGDPTEVALLEGAVAYGLSLGSLGSQSPRVAEWSFDSDRKRMSVAAQSAGETLLFVKGAPEAILPLCIDDHDKQSVEKALATLSEKGRRVLALATRSLTGETTDLAQQSHSFVENNLTFLGLVSIADPPRPETIPAIQKCKASGIRVVMITGDHPATAKSIARELGIVIEGKFDGVMTGVELDKLSVSELEARVDSVAVYARVSPEHKLKIVKAWQNKGNVVAMTGDGVNDAPALKQASIGIAMGKGGTEVAKQASSMILTDDNFATIVAAVEEGRAIYGNIRRTIQYLLSGNLSEILIMLGAAIVGWPAPLAAIQLLWINLVTDGIPALALAAEPVPANHLETSTRPSPQSFFDRQFYNEMALVGVTTMILALGVYGYSLAYEDEITARTHVFSFLVFAELFRSFACRSETKTFFQMGLFSNVYHLAAVAFPISFQLLLHHTPWFQSVFKVQSISWSECVPLLLLTLIPVTIIEVRKHVKQRSVNCKVRL